jgi:hypothetical protein
MFYQKQLLLDVQDAPAIVAPLDGSTIEHAQPTMAISWSGAVDTSSVCVFELAQAVTFDEILAAGTTKSSGNEASWTPEDILTEGMYYWRAKRGNSDYSATASFSVVAPIFVSPVPFSYDFESMTVHNLPASGDRVVQLENLSGDFNWDVRNSSGEKLASDPYLWYVRLDGKTISMGKFIVKR